MKNLPIHKLKLIEGRALHILRATLFLPTLYAIAIQNRISAFLALSVMLLIGWYTSFQLKHQEHEKPFYMLWLNVIDMILSLSVFGVLLATKLNKNEEIPLMLMAATSFLFIRAVAYPIFMISILREGKMECRMTFWGRASNLSIIAAIMVRIWDLQHFQQIALGIMMLCMVSSAVSFLYWYYRDADHRRPLSVSNQLTLSRILLTPVFIWVFTYDNDLVYHNNNVIFQSLAIFMVVTFMVTDFLDGYLARKWGEVSTLGKYLDPFSDKISNMTIFLCFMASGYAHVWMVALIYFREASVETLRTLAANQNTVMPARTSGKWKTAIQGTGILFILIFTLDPIQDIFPHWSEALVYFPQSVMGVITVITLLSGVDYFWSGRDILKKYL